MMTNLLAPRRYTNVLVSQVTMSRHADVFLGQGRGLVFINQIMWLVGEIEGRRHEITENWWSETGARHAATLKTSNVLTLTALTHRQTEPRFLLQYWSWSQLHETCWLFLFYVELLLEDIILNCLSVSVILMCESIVLLTAGYRYLEQLVKWYC